MVSRRGVAGLQHVPVRTPQIRSGSYECLGDNGKNPDNYGEDNYRYVVRDLAREPKKPTVDGEPSYEQILQGLHDRTQGYWQAEDTRRYAYWSVFAGSFGHTFGDNAIMQFYVKERDGAGSFGVWQEWDEALHNSGRNGNETLKRSDGEGGLPERKTGSGSDRGRTGRKYDYVQLLQERILYTATIICTIPLRWICPATLEPLKATGQILLPGEEATLEEWKAERQFPLFR